MSLKQEKQARTRKKHEKTSKKQEPAFENKNKTPISLYEAKRQVFSLTQQGWNYREISQVSFLIEGLGVKRFSISEIYKIKNEFLGGSRDESTNSSTNPNEDKSEIFRLIKNGTKLEDIVISTGHDPEFVKETFDQYMRLKNLSPSLIDEIIDLLRKKRIECRPESLKQTIQKMVEGYQILDILVYRCAKCKKLVSLSPFRDNKDWVQDLGDAMDFLSLDHFHPECL